MQNNMIEKSKTFLINLLFLIMVCVIIIKNNEEYLYMALNIKKVLSDQECEKIDETVDNYLSSRTKTEQESDYYYNYLSNLNRNLIYKEKNAKKRFVFYSLIMYFYGLTPLLNHVGVELTHTFYSLCSLFSGLILTFFMGLRTKRMALFRRKMELRSKIMQEKMTADTINGFYRLMPNEQAKSEFMGYLSHAKEKNIFIVKSFVRKQRKMV